MFKRGGVGGWLFVRFDWKSASDTGTTGGWFGWAMLCKVKDGLPMHFNNGKCGHNLGVDRVHNTWPKLCLMIKCISLPCLFLIHCLFSRSCLGAHQPAINGSAWPKSFELNCTGFRNALQFSSKNLGHAEPMIEG